MKFQVKKLSSDAEETGTLVVFTTPSKKSVSVDGADQEILLTVEEAFTNKVFEAQPKESLFFRNSYVGGFKHLLAIGLGDTKKISNENLREAGAVTYQQLKAQKALTATVHLDSLLKQSKPATDGLQAFVEGLLLAAYDFDHFKSKKTTSLDSVTLGCGKLVTTAKAKSVLEVAEILAEATNLTRILGDSPGNKMTPTLLAKAAAPLYSMMIKRGSSLDP